MSPEDISPLIGYPGLYFAIALVLLIAAIALIPRPRLLRRRRSAPATASELRFAPSFESEVAHLRERYAAGETDVRALHLAAADIARRYGSNVSGDNLRALTLAQLHARADAHELAPVIAVVEMSERPSFDVHPDVAAERTLTALSEMLAGGGR